MGSPGTEPGDSKMNGLTALTLVPRGVGEGLVIRDTQVSFEPKQARRAYGDSNKMPASLPSKFCICCGRPFQWRRKWARCWDEVKYCSERCRRRKKPHLGISANEGD